MSRPPGPAPKPANVSWLHGDPGKRGRGRPGAEADRPGLPETPEDLSDREAELWHQLSAQLLAACVITPRDGLALRHLVEAQARYEDCNRQIGDRLLVKTPGGFPMQHPLIPVAKSAQKMVIDLLQQFGVTPSSRARVSRLQPEAGADSPSQEGLFDT